MMPGTRPCFTWTAVAVLLVIQVAMPRAQGQRASTNAQQGRGSSAAQAQRPEWMSLLVVKVKPGMATAFQDFVKSDVMPALKKTGMPWSLAYTAAPFGDGDTFTFAAPIASFAQFDQPDPFAKQMGPEGLAKLDAAASKMIESTRRVGLMRRADLSYATGTATEPSRLISVVSIRVAASKMDAFSTLVKADLIPVNKKAGVKSMDTFMTIFGEPQGTFTFVSPISNFAEIDLGPAYQRVLKGEALRQFEARANALVTGVAVEFDRLIPELSFGTPGQPASTK